MKGVSSLVVPLAATSIEDGPMVVDALPELWGCGNNTMVAAVTCGAADTTAETMSALTMASEWSLGSWIAHASAIVTSDFVMGLEVLNPS